MKRRRASGGSLPRHVIWDFNGTLLDDTQASINALNIILGERQLPLLDTPRYRRSFGFPVKEFYRGVGIEPEQCDWAALAERFHALYLQEAMSVAVGAREALQYFAQAGVPQSLLSACETEVLTRLLKRHKLYESFCHIYGSDNYDGVSKVERGRSLLARLGGEASEILLIGDTLHDAEVAAALGCACLLVAAGHQNRARLASSGYAVISSLSELRARAERGRLVGSG